MGRIKNTIRALVNFGIRIRYNISKNYSIGKNTRVIYSEMSPNVTIGDNCDVAGSLIGKYTYLGNNSRLPHTKIGAFCSIAPDVVVAAGMHPTHYVSTSPATYSLASIFKNKLTNEKRFYDEFVYVDDNNKYYCEIGNDVWIATRVTLVCGRKALHIGDGAVIRAGAIVTKDVPPYAIVQGSPAKIVGYRFDSDAIDYLLKIQWWNKDDDWIARYLPYFNNVEEFIYNYKMKNND